MVEGNVIGFVPASSLDGPEEAAPSLAAPGPSSSSSSPAPTVQLREYAGVFEPVLPGVDGILGYPPTVTGLGDGRVLALADGQLQVFDPATDRLTTTGRTVAQRTTGAALVPLSDGLVLITGGDSAAFPDETGDAALGSATAEILDPATGLSTPVGGVAAPWRFAAARLANGNVLVAGGTVNVAAGEESPALAAASVFDPATRRFADVGNMVIPRAGHRIVPLLDGGALVVGGAQDATAERYDPATGTFTVTGAMSDPGVATAVRLLDGRVLVIHGWCSELQPMDRDGFGTGYRPVSTEIFDPSSGRFVPSADLPHCVSSATLLPTGAVLVEGFWGEGRRTGQAESLVGPGKSWSGRFDPVTGELVESAEPDRYRATPVALPDGSVLFVGGVPLGEGSPTWATRYR